jgi:hypothetical protein
MIDRRGLSLEEFWPMLGISRATLFNWLKRDAPPPSKEHQEKLVSFFGMSRDYVLFGRPSKLDPSNISPIGVVKEERGQYGEAAVLLRELRQRLEQLIELAGDNTARLGYLVESVRALKVPEHWTVDIHDQVLRELLEEERRTGGRQPAQSETGKTQEGAGR